MKKSIVVVTVVVMSAGFLLGKSPSLSFKVGGQMSTAQLLFGSRTVSGRAVIPAVGFDYFSISSKSKNGDEADFAVRFLIPGVEARVAGPRVENLRSYLLVGGFAIVPLVSASGLSADEEGDVKDVLDLLGLTVGWGVEHFLSPQFSIGGEASLNWNFHDIQIDSFDTRSTFAASAARLTFNFYFR